MSQLSQIYATSAAINSVKRSRFKINKPLVFVPLCYSGVREVLLIINIGIKFSSQCWRRSVLKQTSVKHL